MPDSNFKLSLNVEADLSRLDNSLSRAASKVSAAGSKMQADLFSRGVGGGGGGLTGVSTIAAPAASGPGVMGTSVSFGGGANISTQSTINAQLQRVAAMTAMPGVAGTATAFGGAILPNSIAGVMGTGVAFGGGLNAATQSTINAQLANTANSKLGVAMVSNIATRMGGGGGYGMPSWGRMAAGIGGAAYIGKEAIDSAVTMLGAYDNARLAQNYREIGSSGYAEQMSAAAAAEAKMRAVPALGWIRGASLDIDRQSAYAAGDYANSASPADKASGAFDLRAIQYRNQQGFMGGGYGGKLTTLSQQSDQFLRDVIGKQGHMAPNDFSAYVSAGIKDLNRTFEETKFTQSQKLQDISSYTQQSQMRALGGNLFANLNEIQRQFSEPIATLERQNNPDNRPELEALRKQQSAATMEALIGGIRPAQEFTPGTMATGSRVQGIFGQDQKTLQTLMHMDANIGASLMQATVGRN